MPASAGSSRPVRTSNTEPCSHAAAPLQHDDIVGQPRHLVERMTDIEHRQLRLVAQPFEIGQDFRAALGVQRRQRLVEEQDLRRRQQRAAERNAAFLAAGQQARAPLEQAAQAEKRDDAVDLAGIGFCPRRGASRTGDCRARSCAERGARPGTPCRRGAAAAARKCPWRCRARRGRRWRRGPHADGTCRRWPRRRSICRRRTRRTAR